MTESTSLNMGDIVATIFILGSVIIPVIIIFIIYKIIKRNEKRAIERLSLERENTVLLKNEIADLNERVSAIENMLREVE